MEARASAGTPTIDFTFQEINVDGDVTNVNKTATLNTVSYQTFSWTAGKAVGNDIQLESDTVGGRIKLYKHASSKYHIRNIKVLGTEVELSKGWIVQLDENTGTHQNVGENYQGDIRAAASLSGPLKVFQLNGERFRAEDYKKLYDFITSPDVLFGKYPCLYTDDLDNEYFGRFDFKSINFKAKDYMNALIGLRFQEIAY